MKNFTKKVMLSLSFAILSCCMMNLNAQGGMDDINICAGETVNLVSPPAFNIPLTCSSVEGLVYISPNIGVVNSSDLIVAPIETITYTVTRTQGAWGPSGDPNETYECASSPQSYQITINVDENCGPISEDYPWIADLADGEDCCELGLIQEYNSGPYSYIYVSPAASCDAYGILYNSEGLLYCTSAPGFDCVSLYGLSNADEIWSCDGETDPGLPEPCICTAVVMPVCANGISYSNACVASCAGETSWTDGPCNGISLEISILYPWLEEIILSEDDCCEVGLVQELSSGPYTYIYISPADACDGYGTLYSSEGQLYCSNGPGFDCVNLYGLSGANVLWSCDGDTSEPITPEPPISGEIDIPSYPWITASTDCEIYEYSSGPYSYIVIDGVLYDSEGQLYCTSAPGFDCVSLYGLSNQTLLWSCDDGVVETPETPCAYEYTGTVFYDPCDGQIYYFIELADGMILDPYVAEGETFPYTEGEIVAFSYEVSNFTSPCSGALAVDLVCIQSLGIPTGLAAYPWLSSVVDANDCCYSTSVYEYTINAHSYIYVVGEVGCNEYGILYDSNGQLYCTSAENYDCVSLYGLSNPTLIWSCDGSGKSGDYFIKEKDEIAVSVYPNPSQGLFNVDMTGISNEAILNIYNLNGQQILTQQSTQTSQLDLTNYPKGIYVMHIIDGDQVISKKLMVE